MVSRIPRPSFASGGRRVGEDAGVGRASGGEELGWGAKELFSPLRPGRRKAPDVAGPGKGVSLFARPSFGAVGRRAKGELGDTTTAPAVAPPVDAVAGTGATVPTATTENRDPDGAGRAAARGEEGGAGLPVRSLKRARKGGMGRLGMAGAERLGGPPLARRAVIGRALRV